MTEFREEIARLNERLAPRSAGWERIELALECDIRGRLTELAPHGPDRSKRVQLTAVIIMMELWLMGVPLPPAASALLWGVRRFCEEKNWDARSMEMWTVQGMLALRHFIPVETLALIGSELKRSFPEAAASFSTSLDAEGAN